MTELLLLLFFFLFFFLSGKLGIVVGVFFIVELLQYFTNYISQIIFDQTTCNMFVRKVLEERFELLIIYRTFTYFQSLKPKK